MFAFRAAAFGVVLFGRSDAETLAQQSAINAASSPIRKVITLLEEMKSQIEKEGKEDTEAFDKYNCWCVTYDKEKTVAIEHAEQRITELSAFIEEAAAKEGEYKTEIASLETGIAEDQKAVADAAGVREQEHSAFAEEEADMKETRGLLLDAVHTLSKVQLLQNKTGMQSAEVQHARQAAADALVQIKHVVVKRYPQFQSVMQRDLYDVLGAMQGQEGGSLRGASLEQAQLLPWEKTEEQEGMEAKPNDAQGAAAGAKSYNSRSGKILGILGEMESEFTRDLSSAQKAEFQSEVGYQKLRAAKLAEIAAGQSQKEQKEEALADILDEAAKAKEDIESTKNALSEDEQFLVNLKTNCKSENEEHNSRVQARNEEIRALGEALKILSADAARDLYSKTISFFQVDGSHSSDAASVVQRAKVQDELAERALQRIAKVARRTKSWALLSLGVRIRLDAFTEVKKVMDKMLAELEKQQKEEYDKMEFCRKELDTNEDDIKVAEQAKEDLQGKHTDITNTLAALNAEIADLKAEVAEMEDALKKSGESRHEENAIYQQSVMDQRATVNILQKALKRLKSFYSSGGALVQNRQHQEPGAAAPPPPPRPKAYEQSASAGGVLQLLMEIIADAERTEQTLLMTEQKAQASYASFVKDTTSTIEAHRAAVQEKEGQVAAGESDKSLTEEGQLANTADLEKLNQLLAARHMECDFTVKYFDVRQQARSEEMDAIKDAKAILSGSMLGKDA